MMSSQLLSLPQSLVSLVLYHVLSSSQHPSSFSGSHVDSLLNRVFKYSSFCSYFRRSVPSALSLFFQNNKFVFNLTQDTVPLLFLHSLTKSLFTVTVEPECSPNDNLPICSIILPEEDEKAPQILNFLNKNKLPKVKQLQFHCDLSLFTDSFFNSLVSTFPSLEKLVVTYTFNKDINLKFPPTLSRLTSLELKEGMVSSFYNGFMFDEDPVSGLDFSHLSNLQTLKIDGSSSTKVSGLSKNSCLENLDLKFVEVSDELNQLFFLKNVVLDNLSHDSLINLLKLRNNYCNCLLQLINCDVSELPDSLSWVVTKSFFTCSDVETLTSTTCSPPDYHNKLTQVGIIGGSSSVVVPDCSMLEQVSVQLNRESVKLKNQLFALFKLVLNVGDLSNLFVLLQYCPYLRHLTVKPYQTNSFSSRISLNFFELFAFS
ncbi:hypothetical protein RCL1_008592 [Eukaryota sp. TZLM3-RCL]